MTTALELAADRLEGIPSGVDQIRTRALERWPTPGAMALELVPNTIQTPMLERIDQAMVDADQGHARRWIINTPPQEGKTWRVCRDSALWLLLRNPDRRVVIASYQQTVAERSTLDARQLIESFGTRPGSQDEDDRMGVSVDPSRRAAGNWRLAGHRGGMVAVGIGSGITGRPGDVVVVDDPVADAEEADSPVMRAKVVNWWTSVVLSRLVPTSIVVVVQTRWHEEDLAGWLQSNETPGAPRFRVLSVPAQAELNDQLGRQPGEWLESARKRTPEDWEETRKDVIKGGSRWWYALYQQRPAPPEGEIFQLEWFDRDRVQTRPPGSVMVVVDPADNQGTGDEAGVLVASSDSENRIYLGPDYSARMTTARWVRVAILAMLRHGGASIAYEQSLSGLDRAVKDGWSRIYKQARALRRYSSNGWPTQPDLDVIEACTVELTHTDDPDSTRVTMRSDLLEMWPLVPVALEFPDTGPIVRKIKAKGTKQTRMQMVASLWEHRRVSHVGHLGTLEHQLLLWQPGQDSPDRADAAVYAVGLLSGRTQATLQRPVGNIPTRSTSLRQRGGAITRSTRR